MFLCICHVLVMLLVVSKRNSLQGADHIYSAQQKLMCQQHADRV